MEQTAFTAVFPVGPGCLIPYASRLRMSRKSQPPRITGGVRQLKGKFMDGITIARGLHVLGVVLWIGGVGFVTTVLLPAVRRFKTPAERVAFFDAIERRFAWQARATTLLVGATGFYMMARLDLWSRFHFVAYWWMYAMVAVWLLFTVMLFIAEPLILHRKFHERARSDPEGAFAFIERMHQALLAVSLITVFGAVAGSHGLLLFE
jgi:uncharacterized membrane protein